MAYKIGSVFRIAW